MEKKKKEMTLREYISKTNKYRVQEEETRPRIEIWPDPWAEWVMSHKKDKADFYYCIAEGKASPLCPIGHH